MRSIAIFPCSHTYGATIIGELSTYLRLKVYTDGMLFSDVSEQFGIPAEKVESMIYDQRHTLHRYLLRKERSVNLLKCSLEAQTMYSPARRLYYGLHTSLLDIKKDRVLKVLVFDEIEHRVKRAMQQEGIKEKIAREHIRKHDEKVSGWTNFLVNKEAYDQTLYDVVIPLNNRHPLHVVTDLTELFKNFENSSFPLNTYTAVPVLEKNLYMANQQGV
jgi:two-component system, OmpR family, response regulator CpxR